MNPIQALAEATVSTLLEDDIPGGRAPDSHRWGHLDTEQLAVGTKVEMEHTRDPAVAEEIAADHLTEDPNYYRKLQKAGLADELKPKPKADIMPGGGVGGPVGDNTAIGVAGGGGV